MRLDDHHVLIRLEWQAAHQTSPIPVEASFVLRREAGGYEIVVYLNHTDLSAHLNATRSTP